MGGEEESGSMVQTHTHTHVQKMGMGSFQCITHFGGDDFLM